MKIDRLSRPDCSIGMAEVNADRMEGTEGVVLPVLVGIDTSGELKVVTGTLREVTDELFPMGGVRVEGARVDDGW